MNLLYISHLSGAAYAGPTYSVPSQIESQSKIDNVLWFNATTNSPDHWKQLSYYYDLNEIKKESITVLPEPFNIPDCIIVEQFYNMMRSPLLKELLAKDIPYIIVPRGELTRHAQKRKCIKKLIANFLLCRKFARKATAIQFLTEQEKKDSGNKWNSKSVIIPNGISMPIECVRNINPNKIRCISIGRIEPYQKGLDLLIEACSSIQNLLRMYHCTIELFGPDKEDKLDGLKKQVISCGLSDIVSFKDAVYGEAKAKVLMESDIFLLPSRFEGHPMALIEALSFGLPVVVTKGSNMKSEIETFDAGWTSENSSESLKVALIQMLEDRDSFEQKSHNAKKLSFCYSWDVIAKKNHMELEKLLGKN